jgi:DNA polymerase I-like protein with 3'-5' exonuclease and polymerase domains
VKFVAKDLITIDLETDVIERRPHYPPIPVGAAIKDGHKASKYYAWAHPNGGNNCSWEDARQILAWAYESGRPLLFHNERFDTEVIETHMQLTRPEWWRIHDTLPMLFLRNPHAKSLALKPASEEILDLPPDERDEVVQWLVDHQPVSGIRLSDKPKSKNFAGKYIWLAPGKIVGKYARGDTDRTFKLAVVVHRELERRGMLEAYDRERRLSPHLVQMERQGVRVDLERLERDIQRYEKHIVRIDSWLYASTIKRTFNVDSSRELANALVSSGICKEKDFGLTPSKKMATNKAALKQAIKDPHLIAVLSYRSQLSTCLGTFMRPWAGMARDSGGFIYNGWNPTLNDERGGERSGARTGRLSSKPINLQNIPTEFKPLFYSKDHKNLPRCKLEGGAPPPLPLVRSYVIPYEEGHVLIGRDYSQQELRAMGHFEGGVLCEAYQKDPWMDVHEYAQTMINEMLQANFPRKPIKTIGFGLLYGMGIGLLAERTDSTVEMAKKLKAAYLEIFPGLRAMYKIMKERAATNKPIRTWGGREYYCEPPVWSQKFGRWQTFDYKLVNVLIQGSSADCTKEAGIRYMDAKPKHHRCLMTVHDEFCSSIPMEELHVGMEVLRKAMESVKFDVPMLSEGTWSDKNWASMKPFDKKGKVLCHLGKSARK